jgi:hypothetical protein
MEHEKGKVQEWNTKTEDRKANKQFFGALIVPGPENRKRKRVPAVPLDI